MCVPLVQSRGIRCGYLDRTAMAESGGPSGGKGYVRATVESYADLKSADGTKVP